MDYLLKSDIFLNEKFKKKKKDHKICEWQNVHI